MTTDAQLRSLLRSLATLQTLDVDRQGVVIAPDRGGRGTPDADGKRVAQIDSGDVAKAHGPIKHRSALALHEAAEVEAMARATDAKQLASTLKAAHGALNAATLKAGAEALRVEARATTARLNAATDRAALVAWGRVVIERCVREWEAT